MAALASRPTTAVRTAAGAPGLDVHVGPERAAKLKELGLETAAHVAGGGHADQAAAAMQPLVDKCRVPSRSQMNPRRADSRAGRLPATRLASLRAAMHLDDYSMSEIVASVQATLRRAAGERGDGRRVADLAGGDGGHRPLARAAQGRAQPPRRRLMQIMREMGLLRAARRRRSRRRTRF